MDSFFPGKPEIKKPPDRGRSGGPAKAVLGFRGENEKIPDRAQLSPKAEAERCRELLSVMSQRKR